MKSGVGTQPALSLLATIALQDLGACEQPRGSNRGPRLAKFFKADAYEPKPRDEGYPWCAAAVSFWVQQFLFNAGPEWKAIKAPRLSAAYSFMEWGRANGALVVVPREMAAIGFTPQAGDIVVFTFSHVGIVTKPATDTFVAVEGNTDDAGSREGWEVATRVRYLRDVKAFVRMRPTFKGQKIS